MNSTNCAMESALKSRAGGDVHTYFLNSLNQLDKLRKGKRIL